MIGIICAMQVEADGILALCENKQTNEKYGIITAEKKPTTAEKGIPWEKS